MDNEILKRAAEIIRHHSVHGAPNGEDSYCALGLLDLDGSPTVSTITVSRSSGLDWMTFCTGLRSDKAKRIANCPRASVCFNTGGAFNITLVGSIEILTDPAIKEEMWYSGLEHHFSGPDDPNYCVLRFKAERYNLFVDGQETQGKL